MTSYFVSLISCTKVQLIHFVTHFHHIHLTDHSLSDSHSPFGFSHTALYFNVSLCLSFFQPIPKALYGHDQKTQTLFWTLKKSKKIQFCHGMSNLKFFSTKNLTDHSYCCPVRVHFGKFWKNSNITKLW